MSRGGKNREKYKTWGVSIKFFFCSTLAKAVPVFGVSWFSNFVCLRWRPWIPDPTACTRGFGLYDDAADEFVDSREKANSCKACALTSETEQMYSLNVLLGLG